MLKKVIKYTDFDGNERTKGFFFNLTQAEVTELELSKEGGLVKLVERLYEEQDKQQIILIFKEIILMAYGEKSDDGERFMKSPEISAKFACTQAYSDLFMELSSDTEAATAFIKGIIPTPPPQSTLPKSN